MGIWIARDKDGSLCLFNVKPLRERYGEYYSTGEDYYLPIDDDMFPEVTFENSPQKVELKLVEEENGNK